MFSPGSSTGDLVTHFLDATDNDAKKKDAMKRDAKKDGRQNISSYDSFSLFHETTFSQAITFS